MDYDEFDARRRALLRLARPQDLIGADGELIDLHDAGFWLWRYAAVMQVVKRPDWPPPGLEATTRAELRQLVTMALQVIRALQRRQARMPAPSWEG